MITRNEFEERFRNRINDELMHTLDDDYPDKQEELAVQIYQELYNEGVEISLEDEDRLALWVCDYSEESVESFIKSWSEG